MIEKVDEVDQVEKLSSMASMEEMEGSGVFWMVVFEGRSLPRKSDKSVTTNRKKSSL